MAPPKQLQDFLQALFSYHVLLRYACVCLKRHTHFELGFSVRLNCHDGKEGEGTERCMGRQKQYCLKMFPNGLEVDLYNQCGDKLSCRKVGLGEET